MTTVDLVGWLAGSLVLTASYVKTMLPLRCVALAGNIAFITYGLLAGATPILALHALLLPLNLLRLCQLWRSGRRTRKAGFGQPSPGQLDSCFERHSLAAGDKLFDMGDPADKLLLLLRGHVRMVETGERFGPGELVETRAIFAPGRCHGGTAVCAGPVQLASLDAQVTLDLFYKHPELGAELTRLALIHREGIGADPVEPPQGFEATRQDTIFRAPRNDGILCKAQASRGFSQIPPGTCCRLRGRTR